MVVIAGRPSFRDKRAPAVKMNKTIRASEVRVVTDEGEQLGVLSISDALSRAEEAGLDLVEITSNAKPPVCKIMDYGKFKYETKKKAHESKKKQTVIHVKEVKMRSNTEEHDLQFKLKNAKKFLEAGDKVKVSVVFRGREIARPERGREMLAKVTAELEELSTIEQYAKQEGRNMVMVFGPKTKKK